MDGAAERWAPGAAVERSVTVVACTTGLDQA
jgi:hypothetical protein